MDAARSHDLHTFSLVTRDHPGVLVRIALVFARRSFNIESLAVSPGAQDGFARFTITSSGDPESVDQILKQLGKLVDVVFVTAHRELEPIEVEIALVKLRCSGERREAALRIANERGAHVVDENGETLILSATGTSTDVSALIDSLADEGIEELVRSGRIVMDRGASQFAHLIGPRG